MRQIGSALLLIVVVIFLIRNLSDDSKRPILQAYNYVFDKPRYCLLNLGEAMQADDTIITQRMKAIGDKPQNLAPTFDLLRLIGAMVDRYNVSDCSPELRGRYLQLAADIHRANDTVARMQDGNLISGPSRASVSDMLEQVGNEADAFTIYVSSEVKLYAASLNGGSTSTSTVH